MVTINAQLEGDEVKIIIKDNGFGISEEDIPHLFEKFYRTVNAQNSGIEGTGLGLAIVKAIVEEHKGHISIESELGTGTTVSITLPRLDYDVPEK